MAKDKLLAGLNVYLADLNVLNVKMHNFHWNLTGSGFFSLHAAYEGLYDALFEEIDEVAERLLMIGGRPAASLKSYAALATLSEADSVAIDGPASIRALQKDYEALTRQLRALIALAQEAGDEGTVDLCVGALKSKEKTLWMLNASLA